MTTSERDGGPAFPPVHDPATHPSGMSLRDYFAAQALPMLLHPDARDSDPLAIARYAYQIANAMLAERSKR